MDAEQQILETFDYVNNILIYRKSRKKVPRPRAGYVAFLGKLWKTSEIIRTVISEKKDRRQSASFDMARQFPELKVSRKEAEGLGLTIYRTGRACKRGHQSWRFVSNGACLTCYGKL